MTVLDREWVARAANTLHECHTSKCRLWSWGWGGSVVECLLSKLEELHLISWMKVKDNPGLAGYT